MDNTFLGNGFLKVWIDKKLVKLTNENIKQVKVEDIVFQFFMDAESISNVKNLVPNTYNGVTKNQFYLVTRRIKAENVKTENSPTYFLVEDEKEAEYRKSKTNTNATSPF